MAKSSNQKLKLMYLAEIFERETNEEHGLSVDDLRDRLLLRGVKADRKTLYLDFEDLRTLGYDIIEKKVGRHVFYYLGSRKFELVELKLLVDAVQSSKFITEKKTRALIKKLGELTNTYDGGELSRQVIIAGSDKTDNETIFYNVDDIHHAIRTDKKIKFRYFRWTVEKKKEYRHGGKYYKISPWALVWDDENYYMVGYDSAEKTLKHFRVDKMSNVGLLEESREGGEVFETKNLPDYSRQLFGMFGGEPMVVILEAQNEMAGVFIDRFGRDISLMPKGKDHFTVRVKVELSDQFISWIAALGPDVRILSPEGAVNKIREMGERLAAAYAKKA